jgi:methylglyoxal synthase
MRTYIALIAHDAKKDAIVRLATQFKDVLSRHPLVGTGETGHRIENETGLTVK